MGVTVVVSGGNVTVTTGAPASGSVSNSDDSYTATVAAGGSLEIPDITITKNDDSTVTYPAAKDMDLGVIDPCVPSAPSGWDAMVAAYGIGYNYPMSDGQTTSFLIGDNAWVEANVFTVAVRAANGLKPQQSLASMTVLNNVNVYNNLNRFTDELGGQTYTNNLVIDHFTGLMWYKVIQSGDWATQIQNAQSSTIGGFSDWFQPNIYQWFSIADWELSGGSNFNYPPFNETNGYWWTSATKMNATTSGMDYRPINPTVQSSSKATSGVLKTYFCRKHY